MAHIRASAATSSTIAASPVDANQSPTNSCENNAPSISLVYTGEVPPSLTPYSDVQNTLRGARLGVKQRCYYPPSIVKELTLNQTGPFKVSAVGLSSAAGTPDGQPLGDKLLYPNLPSNLSGLAAKPLITAACCTPCANPYDADNMPPHLLANASTITMPLYHITLDDVSTPAIFIEINVYAVEALYFLSCGRHNGMSYSTLHGNANWIFKRPETTCLLGNRFKPP